MKRTNFIIAIAVTLLCNFQLIAQKMNHDEKQEIKAEEAICVLSPTQGNNVTGTITFTKMDDGIKVVANLQGLNQGKHGFHIHEFGNCSAADGTSAGGHFNPEGKPHGAPMAAMSHEGDLGNIEADATGNAHLEYLDKMLSFTGTRSIIGRSFIVHKNEDDLTTQPTGNAGARVACGVIGLSKFKIESRK